MEKGSYTENYKLLKPAKEDFYNVEDFNKNADIIDSTLKAFADKDTNLKTLIDKLAEVAKSGSYNDLIGKPESLPADGGNADTVDGKHAAEFVLRNSRIITKLSDIKENGFYYTGQWGYYDFMPHNNYTSWTILAISSGDNSWARYLLAFDNSGDFYYCYYTTSDGTNYQIEGGWKKVNDGGNADTVDGKHASDLQDYNNLTNKPSLAAVATSGSYNDLIGKPESLPADGGTAKTISDILPVSKGGTGSSTVMDALKNLKLLNSSFNITDNTPRSSMLLYTNFSDFGYSSSISMFKFLQDLPTSSAFIFRNCKIDDVYINDVPVTYSQILCMKGGTGNYCYALAFGCDNPYTNSQITTLDYNIYYYGASETNTIVDWKKINDDGDADTVDGHHAEDFMLRMATEITKITDIRGPGLYYVDYSTDQNFMPINKNPWIIYAFAAGPNTWNKPLLAFNQYDTQGANIYYNKLTYYSEIQNWKLIGDWIKIHTANTINYTAISNPIAISSIDKYKTEIIIKAYNTPNTANGYFYSDYTCTSSNAGEILQSAIDSAAEGSTVRLLQGNYNINSPISVNKNLTIAGAGIEDTVLIQTGNTADDNTENLFKITVGNVVFKDMKIQTADCNVAPLFGGDSSKIMNGTTWENVYFNMQNEYGGIIDGIAKYCRMINCIICKPENIADKYDICLHSGSLSNIISNTLNMGSGYFNIWCEDDNIKNSCAFSGNINAKLKVGNSDYTII